MNIQEAISKLYELQSKLSAYNHAMSLIYYDGATVAPKKTARNRAHALAVLSEETYKITTSDETVALLEFLDSHRDELEEKEQRIVYLAIRDIKEMKKIPIEEYIAYEKLLVEAGDTWHKAKESSDFELFRPVLEQIFDYNKKIAAYCAPEMHPYDYCLDKYEKGLTIEKCDEFFATLKARIVPLIKRIGEVEQVDDSCIHGDFDEASQEKFSLELMKIMGIDLGICGLGTTEHPFTTSIGSHHDVRITTHYQRDNFASSMFSVIHEGGHALYDMNSDDEYAYTFLDGGVSMGISNVDLRGESSYIYRDNLLNDINKEMREELFRCLRLEANANFDDFANKFGGLTKEEILQEYYESKS
jgi:carboxypeptidase Taq